MAAAVKADVRLHPPRVAAHAPACRERRRTKQHVGDGDQPRRRISRSAGGGGREKVERMAAQIVRDFRDQTPRGVRRAANQRRAGADPASVLDPRCLAAVVANAMRDARRTKRPPRRRGRGVETWRDVPSIPVGDRGDPGLVVSRRPDETAEVEEIADPYPLGNPALWLLALEAAAEAAAEGRSAAPPAPRLRLRRPRPILHLRRATGGAS